MEPVSGSASGCRSFDNAFLSNKYLLKWRGVVLQRSYFHFYQTKPRYFFNVLVIPGVRNVLKAEVTCITCDHSQNVNIKFFLIYSTYKNHNYLIILLYDDY